MAGYAHVIGSLRPANDAICVQVAKYFYASLIEKEDGVDQNKVVAEALNLAILQIVEGLPDNPEMWAPFVHLGA
jgi:hypothetical protein